jgi:hypothetical protein
MPRRLVNVELTSVPAPEPPNAWATTPTPEPTAQTVLPSLLAAPRMPLVPNVVVVVEVSAFPLASTRPITRATLELATVAVPAAAS